MHGARGIQVMLYWLFAIGGVLCLFGDESRLKIAAAALFGAPLLGILHTFAVAIYINRSRRNSEPQ